MSNTIGKNIRISLFGESHGEAVGVMVDGLPSGIKIDFDFLNSMMDRRKAKGNISTGRKEEDEVRIISGLFEGYTSGFPLTILIENKNIRSKDYEAIKDFMRPSHADYTANEKYYGYQDYRGGGHFSGRLTAPLVAAGAICTQILNEQGIEIGSHIAACQKIRDDAFSSDPHVLQKQIQKMNQTYFACLNEEAKEKILAKIEEARSNGDSVGGIIESAIINLPVGLGDPTFDSLESLLAHALFSIGAVKGVEFGLGFEFADHTGSEVNDPIQIEENKVVTLSNHNGGINGGISNGMPVLLRCVIKPTPSIYRPQKTINIKTKENVEYKIEGRHDPAIFHRARVVIDSMIAITVLDALIERKGLLAFMGEKK